MTTHPSHRMHDHSLAAYAAELERITGKKKAVYGAIKELQPCMDRDVLRRLFPHSDDMNRVRPRISELIKDGWVAETAETKDPTTKHKVRLLSVIQPERRAQMSLPLFERGRP